MKYHGNKPVQSPVPAGWRHSLRSGSVLVEAATAIALLGFVAMFLVRGSMNALSGRYWTMAQNMSDAYLTYEVALAQRVPMDDVTGGSTLWPTSPSTATTNAVEIGRLPGGGSVTATLYRTKVAATTNLVAAGGSGTDTTNPARMEAWKLQAHLVYTVGGKSYRKSRTVIRLR